MVNVLDKNRIQITDWRSATDTEYTHANNFVVNGETLELAGYEINDHELITLNGIVYKAIHRPTVLGAVGPLELYPLADVGDYFAASYDPAFKCPREISIMLRLLAVGSHGTRHALISKGDGTLLGTDWELVLDGCELCFYDGVGLLISSTLNVPADIWTTIGFTMGDDGTDTTFKFWVDATSSVITSPLPIRPQTAGDIYISAASSNPANDGVKAYWDWATVWDEQIVDNAMDNALNYLKIQERGLVGNWKFPYAAAPVITDLAKSYEVEI